MPHLQCNKVDDFYLLRDGASGIFLAASQFPRNRETRAPLVEEILTVKDQLDPKHRYLASAPVSDPAGNKAQVRYSRKAREQYVMTEVDGKATGWKAICPARDGQWLIEEKSQSSTRSRKKTVRKKSTKKKAAKKKTTRKKVLGKRVEKEASANQDS
tara:strand:+ start:29 stop:499 length:471 start_codon:yes stop_codon:yes gene_type:complete